MQRDRWTQIRALIVMAISLACSAGLAVALTNSAGRHRLSYADVAVEGQPPQVALGIAMGAFRGIFVNALWIRANQLKEDGRFHESMDLAKAITELQPHFPQVWVFHAWNMAYNISVNCQTAQERWGWVTRGIHLLRDQGIPANPNDMLIHRECAWIFLHKIGGYMDDANLYYKRQLAAEWTLVLGPPPSPDPRDRDEAKFTKKYADWIRPVAMAPDDPKSVVRAEPSVRDLVMQLPALNMGADRDLVQYYVQASYLLHSAGRVLIERNMPDRERKFLALVTDPKYARAWPALLAHLRRRIIIDEYHMEPELMLKYTEDFGPLDWRHWAAHSLYWGQRGIEHALDRYTAENKRDFDFVNAGRIVIQSLQELWRSGDVYFDFQAFMSARGDTQAEDAVFFRFAPQVYFIDSYKTHLDKYVAMSWADQRHRSSYSLYASGYENFVKDAVRFLYRRGEKARANRMKEDLAVWPYANKNNWQERLDLFALNLDQFVMKELEDELTRPSAAREEVIGALEGAFINGLLARDDQLYHEQWDYAKMVHEFYFNAQSHRNNISASSPRMAQMDRDFNWVAGPTFAGVISRLELEDAETLYDQATPNLKQFAYDVLRNNFQESMTELAKAGGRSFDQVFPAPDGMEEFRKAYEDKRKQLARPKVETQ